MSKALMRFDGGARPTNPGHAGFGIVITIDDEEHHLSRYLGRKTNNEAEYIGLIVGIKYAYYLGAREIEIISDSTLIVNQVTGEWFPKDFRMQTLCYIARDLLQEMYPEAWTLRQEKRASNTIADELCTAAIQYGRNRNIFTPAKLKPKDGGRIVDPFRLGKALVGKLASV
jgi:ribonuclease HI